MTIRIRTQKDGPFIGSTFERFAGGSTISSVSQPYILNEDFCEDASPSSGGGPLDIRHITTSGTYALNGRPDSWTVTNQRQASAWPMIGVVANTFAAELPVVGPSDAFLSAQLVSLTNPSRPVVDVPVFVAELGDIPKLFAQATGSLVKKVAKGHLTANFALRPLLADLLDMLDNAKNINDRMKELNALQRKGLSRTRNLWSGSNSSFDTLSVSSSPIWCGVTMRRTKMTTVKVWGHVKWKPDGSFPTTDDAMLRAAYRAIYGLTIDLSTAWELIPFSWLIDYFSNLGDLLKGSRNVVGASHGPSLIMRHTRTEASGLIISSSFSGIKGGSAKQIRELKQRGGVSVPAVSASLSALSGRQLSNLGALWLASRKSR